LSKKNQYCDFGLKLIKLSRIYRIITGFCRLVRNDLSDIEKNVGLMAKELWLMSFEWVVSFEYFITFSNGKKISPPFRQVKFPLFFT
jgi:hypothetical protein